MEIEFDPAKDARNRRDRGLSLALASDILANRIADTEDTRQDYDEQRRIAFGYVGPRLHCLVYTLRDNTLRPISPRKANRKEIQRWHPAEP